MIRRIALTAVVLAGTSQVFGSVLGDKEQGPSAPSKPDRSYGTALQWESKLDTAAKKAEREHKLLMVLAVAGHFEDPFFT